MANIMEGNLSGKELRIVIVASRFNSLITEKLYTGAHSGLRRHGVKEENIDTVWVPGAFEIPSVARRLAEKGKYDAVICLGAVIRGATPHFDYVAAEVAKGIANVAFNTNVPTIFGVLTTNNIEQALERVGGKGSNKGFEAGIAAIEMANLMKNL